MILAQLSVSPLMRESNGYQRLQGIFRTARHETRAASKDGIQGTNSSSSKFGVMGSVRDSHPVSRAFFQAEAAEPSVIRNSSLNSEAGTNGNNRYLVQNAKLENKQDRSSVTLLKYSNAVPSVTDDFYHNPTKHHDQNGKKENVDFSAESNSQAAKSKDALLEDKLKSHRKNLTALLSEIPVPTAKSDYDIVSPGASAEDVQHSEHPSEKPLCPAEPPALGE